MNRRQFFHHVGKKAVQRSVEALEEKLTIPVNWIRPPFAIPEPEFLLTCIRCDACIDACPHNVIFSLQAKSYAPAKGTPALNLLKKSCKLCNDWPCVRACESGALKKIESSDELPKFNVTFSINELYCLPYVGPECGVCQQSCPISTALRMDGTKPIIFHESCAGCAQCLEACISNPKAIEIHLIQ